MGITCVGASCFVVSLRWSSASARWRWHARVFTDATTSPPKVSTRVRVLAHHLRHLVHACTFLVAFPCVPRRQDPRTPRRFVQRCRCRRCACARRRVSRTPRFHTPLLHVLLLKKGDAQPLRCRVVGGAVHVRSLAHCRRWRVVVVLERAHRRMWATCVCAPAEMACHCIPQCWGLRTRPVLLPQGLNCCLAVGASSAPTPPYREPHAYH